MNCRHCHTELAGPYCHACGQKAVAEDALTARAIVAELWAHVPVLDFKTVRSLRALVVPGKLTAEFIAGHRVPYLSPLKVYLLCAAIFFLAMPYTALTLDGIAAGDESGLVRKTLDSAIQSSGLGPEHFTDRFDLRFQTVFTVSLSLSVVALALMLAGLFRARRQPAGVHLVFALHYVAFSYLVGIVIGFTMRALPAPVTLLVVFAAVGPYMFFALRRIYGDGTTPTIVKTLVLYLATQVVDSLVNLMAYMITLRVI